MVARHERRDKDDAPLAATLAPLGPGHPDWDNPKVRQLLAAAGRLFLELPYDAVSTDAIAREAKVSKATLYVYFSSKETLFATLVAMRCDHLAGQVWRSTARQGDVEEELRQIARSFIAMLTSPDSLALYRSIVAQSARFPELGRLFYETGPRRFQARLADFLAEATRRGHIHVPDPALGALQFIHLVIGDMPMKGLLALDPIIPADSDAVVEGGIALFMAGYRAQG